MSQIPLRAYLEDGHRLLPGPVSEEVYREAIASFVIVCADVYFVDRARRTLYLAKRSVKPMPWWWGIGGRLFAGEEPEAAAIRHLRQDTSLAIGPDRLSFVAMHRYRWRERQQEPQNVGSDNLAYVFVLELTPDEFSQASRNLNPREYDAELGLREFDWDHLLSEGIHQAVCDLYDQLFR